MKALCRFVGVLAIAAIFVVPAPARSAEMRTDSAQCARDADNFARLTADIAQVGRRIESTGSELAVHMRGQAATAVISSLQRTSDNMRAALEELNGALDSVHASCQQYNGSHEQVLRAMNMGMLRSAKQQWDFGAIEAGYSQMRSDQATLAALGDEVRAARGDFGVRRDRAVMRLGEALHSLAQLNQALGAAAQAMHDNEKCVSGMFSDGAKCKS